MSRLSATTVSWRTSTGMRCIYVGVLLMACSVVGFSVDTLVTSKRASIRQPSLPNNIVATCNSNPRDTALQMAKSQNERERIESRSRNRSDARRVGRKRALLKKYGKAIALSTTLLYSPMVSMPLVRRATGSSAHAASTATAPSQGGAYNFNDFKDVKKKLSLAPGANVQEYEDILSKVEVEGEDALENYKGTALTIGGSGEGSSDNSSSQEQTKTKGRRAAKKEKKQKAAQVSEWESDEFGFGDDDDDDFDSNVLSLGSSSSSSKLSPTKKSEGGGSGDVVLTDKMAYNNYKAPISKTDHTKIIKKGAFYSIFPVFLITLIRGQIKAYKEKKWVMKGLAIREEEYKKYLEEKKKKKEGKGDDDDDDDDDDE